MVPKGYALQHASRRAIEYHSVISLEAF